MCDDKKRAKRLEWLARNLHVWPDDEPWCAVVGAGGNMGRAFVRDRSPLYGVYEAIFTKSEWRAERKRLSGKPSWSDAPEWARWLAQSQAGDWFWYDTEPDMHSGRLKRPAQFIPFRPFHAPKIHLAGRGEVFGDHRYTLEERPELPEGHYAGGQELPRSEFPDLYALLDGWRRDDELRPHLNNDDLRDAIDDAHRQIMETDHDKAKQDALNHLMLLRRIQACRAGGVS